MHVLKLPFKYMLPKKIKGAVLFTGDNHLTHVKDNAPWEELLRT